MGNTNKVSDSLPARDDQEHAERMHDYYGPKGKGWKRAHPGGSRRHHSTRRSDGEVLCREMRICGNVESIVHGFLAGYGDLFTEWRRQGFTEVPSDLWKRFLTWMHPEATVRDCPTCRELVGRLLDFLERWREGNLPPDFSQVIRPLAPIKNGGEVDNMMIQKMMRWVRTQSKQPVQ